MPQALLEWLDHWTGKNPNKLLYSFLDRDGNQLERYTYASFRQRVQAIGACLVEDHRLRPGDRVLLVYPPGLEMICAFFACVGAGLIPVPVQAPSPHAYPDGFAKLAHIAADCQGAAVLTTDEYLRAWKDERCEREGSEASPPIPEIARMKRIATDHMREAENADFRDRSGTILFLQYTSGSTSRPKGVIVTHANIAHNCGLVADHANPVAVSWLPQQHDMGLIGYYLYSLLRNGTTYGFAPVSFLQRPALWLDLIKEHRATASSAPNFAFDYCLGSKNLAATPPSDIDLSSLRILMAAAEPVRPDTYLRFLRKFEPYGLRPESFFVAYGLAENTLAVSNYGRRMLSVSNALLACGKVAAVPSGGFEARLIASCGRPLGDIVVRIVDPERRTLLDDKQVGEIWVSGGSKCQGYWNQPALTDKVFHAHIAGEGRQSGYLRTGDLGFLYENELYVCGRVKDLIILGGKNYYPEDIERAVEQASDLIRPSRVVAFEINAEGNAALAVVAEVKRVSALPEARRIVAAIRREFGLQTATIAFAARGSIPRTTSGKLMRLETRRRWLDGRLKLVGGFPPNSVKESSLPASPLAAFLARYGLTGTETHTLVEAGVDSLGAVLFVRDMKQQFARHGAAHLADRVDFALIQQISIADLTRISALLEMSPRQAVEGMESSLASLKRQYRIKEEDTMRKDTRLASKMTVSVGRRRTGRGSGILLTGATGFFGSFLLKSLLDQTDQKIYALARPRDGLSGVERLQIALEKTGASDVRDAFETRIIPVGGDLEKPRLGLSTTTWERLVRSIGTIYHNAAAVNYLHNYSLLRNANVIGTREVLRLACEDTPKTFNYISTTFIFGWSTALVLRESDTNPNMDRLDFGYSQSKWVAERLVLDMMGRGLPARILRPALLTPSLDGRGETHDIAIRLFAFMINHGIGIDAQNQVSLLPVNVAAHNIVAIADTPSSLHATFHVTEDEYANMTHITDIISGITGRTFRLFKITEFIPEVVRRCTRDDPLFPLLDFLVSSADKIAAMEFKRYNNACYQQAREASRMGMSHPPLEDTVGGLFRYLRGSGLIAK